MQASLGRKGDYTVRAMLYLARSKGERLKARQIADAMGIPPRYLTQILANLVQHGLLNAIAGPSGGYCMAKPPEEMNLLEVVEAAEGHIGLEECVLHGGPCTWVDSCPIHIPWARAQNAMAGTLMETTFADLVETELEIAAGVHELPADAPPHKIPTTRMRPPRTSKK